ncbi:hypothetical protein B5C34_15580 [Pacificimonas flava]|uniref:peptidylprolyl isomerase n=2 Tax=Pacificimonas TaxID=1960290 RepID=A0A219B0S2_9SPHN|nr:MULTISPECIES: peptidylprolyl isomerase [Pacificimonas]MBZ6379614.1 peptidyl-prolyl cis-trans isomerase [Pacificimonas aurantium]OWV31915.1 hypothetical protein B5C34_15580 [Pacificimonas flava]
MANDVALRGSGLRKVGRDPLTLFLAAGSLAFLIFVWLEDRASEPVIYSEAVEAALVEEFELLAGREAQPEDIARLKKDYLTDELLFREAIDRGIYLTDSQIKSRMVDKMRYLIAGAPQEPSDEEVVDYYAEHLDQYESEPEVSFDQVFFEEEPREPEAILAALQDGDTVAGDDLWTGRSYPDYGHSMVRGIFGQAFLEEVARMKEDRWSGPLRSSRGWHFVLKTGSAERGLLPFARVRDQVRQDLMMSRTEDAIDGEISRLQEKFEVRSDV